MSLTQPALVIARSVTLLAATITFASAQTQDWARQLGTSGDDSVTAAAPDGAGGVFVGGLTTGSIAGPNAGFTDVWIARYDGAGNQVWIRQLGTGADDATYSAEADGVGGVFVAGYTRGSFGTQNAGSLDAWLARYDSAGNLLWIQQLGTTAFDWADGLARDGSGGVFLSGYTYGSLGGPNAGDADPWVARYDGAGNQTWIRQFGNAASNTTTGAVPDGSGGVFVSGYTNGNLGGPSAGAIDAWVARYDASGSQSWIRQFGGSLDEFTQAAAADGAGGVYLCGFTYGSPGGANAGEADAWLTRYDGAGNQAWIKQLGTVDYDYAQGAAPDGLGGVFLTGSTRGSLGGPNAGASDAWLASYSAAGNRTSIQQLGTIRNDRVGAAAAAGAGSVFVCGVTAGDLAGTNAGGVDAWLARYESLDLLEYCTPAIPSSTGQPGVMTATGSAEVVANDFTLVARRLPRNSFGIFLTSRSQGLVMGPGGSQGNLCLGGAIGRYVGPGQIQTSGPAGTFDLPLDLMAMPLPTGPVAVQPGEAWNFQAWFRDANPGLTSNFTSAVSVTFR